MKIYYISKKEVKNDRGYIGSYGYGLRRAR